MKPILGLSRDTAPNDQRPGTYRHAENILLTKLNQAVATEPGNTAEYNKSGYDLVGVRPFPAAEIQHQAFLAHRFLQPSQAICIHPAVVEHPRRDNDGACTAVEPDLGILFVDTATDLQPLRPGTEG